MAVIGIDLGTTNSAAAVMQGDTPEIIVNSEGERVTPSVVAIGRNGERLIGNAAKRQAIVNPANTVYSIKRFIGRPFPSPVIQENLDRFPFKLKGSPKGDVRVEVDGTRFSPEELSSFILQKLRAEAEDFLGESVEQAVITVPAYFDDRQRAATKDAGRIAGLEVLRIINEPTAAALAYGLHRSTNQTLAVYDLGGGTFDISILEQRGLEFRVLATAGDAFLGGDDFDDTLMEWLIHRFEEQHKVELPREPTILQRLKNAAESAKKDLSFSETTQITIPFLTGSATGPLHLDVELFRAEFEHLVEPLVRQTLEPCAQALADAGLSVGDVHGVVLVGGQTRTPLVQRSVEQFFGRAGIKGVNPEEAVALGAAVTAGIGTGEIENVALYDVTPLTLGIETAGGGVSRIIPRNTPIPATASKTFTTTEDDQLIIPVHVVQGERELAADNKRLGRFELVGVRPAPKGTPRITIRFQVDEEGIVHVEAKDEDTGRRQTVRITSACGLSEREIERMVGDADKFRRQDEEARDVVALRNRSMNLVYASRRILDEAADLDPEFRKRLGQAVGELETALGRSAEPVPALQARNDALLTILKEIEYVEPR